jgi:polysaccharide export outer membrane protein
MRAASIAWLVAGLCATAPAAGFAQTLGGSNQTPAPFVGNQTAAIDYPVGPGDLLRIDVYRSPDMSTTVRVSDQGDIVVPAIGPVPVRGLTASAIAALIRDKLITDKILTNPIVNVLVAEINSRVVLVMGAVARAGEIPLDRPGLTIATVLARAGANFGTGDGIVTVIESSKPDAPRRQMNISDVISGREDGPVHDGQIIVVRSPPTVYVSGEVERAGAFPIEPHMTVGQAIALGGGATPRGSMSRFRLSRRQPDGSVVRLKDVHLDTLVAPDDLIVVEPRLF